MQSSEERLRHTLDSLLEGCQIIDFNWRYLYLNHLAAEYGRKPVGELLGRTIMECYPGIEQTELFQSLRQAMEKRVVVVRRENLFHYPDGSSAIFDLEIHPVAEGIFIHSIDVTARHQAEAAREKLAKIVEHSADFIAMADLHGKLIYLNPAGRRMIGVSEDDELNSLQFTDYVPDSWRKDFSEMIATTQQRGLWEGEMQLKHLLTGALIDVSRSVFLIRDPLTGQPLCYATVTRDITARKQTERAFQESEERFSKAFHANPSIIAISTYPDGLYVDVNDAFTRVLGFTREEVVGKRAVDLGLWTVPEQRSQIIAALERGEEIRGFETSIRSRSGSLRTLSASVERIDLGGQPCLLFINHDITDWKKAESASRENQARFQQLAENIQEVFWLSDVSKNVILYVSPAYERIWGRTCASLYESPVSWVEALLPEDRERVLTAAREKQALGEYDIEYRIQRPDGAVRWIHDRAFPVRDAQGQVYRIAGVAEDITDSRQLEAQFRQSQKMEALGTLSGGIAHDFNNILGAIFGNVHLAMLDLADNHPVAGSLSEIEKAAERAKSLVRQILAFSRQQPQARQVGPLAPIIGEATSLLRATLPADVELIKSIDTAAPNVLADPTQIHQILMNLCTNAWHALGDRPGRIEVQLRRVSLVAGAEPPVPGLRTGRYACLSVRDNGQGMDAATLERIFEPFFTTKAPGRGTGLGLSVVHGIVQSHDALLHVASKPGQGTTFQIFFPAIETETDAGPMPATPWPAGNGQRVLYLDDETALVDLAAKMMRKLGYEPETYTRPAGALEAVSADPGRFAVIITDLHMPAMNGLEFCRQVRKIRPDLPIILSSGYLTEEVLAQAHALGIYRLLPKPNTLRDFSEAIHEVLTTKASSL